METTILRIGYILGLYRGYIYTGFPTDLDRNRKVQFELIGRKIDRLL